MAVYKDAQLPVTEGSHNLMTLAKHVHNLHLNCFLAFEPGRKSMDGGGDGGEIHWMRTAHQGRWTPPLPTGPPIEFALVSGVEICCKLHRMADDNSIQSGETITMSTPDSQHLPLLDADILDLQWHLQSAAALAGVAGPQELVGENDSAEEMREFKRNRTESWAAETDDWVTDGRRAIRGE